MYNNATEALPALLHKVLKEGELVESRNGRTLELVMQQVTLLDPDPYITAPGRRVSLPAQIAETMWILAGRNDIEWLSHYLPRAADFSDDGKTWRGGYGPRIREWWSTEGERVDQLAHVVNLLKEDPGTRRAVINIYDPAVDTQPGKDIPCNNWVHFLPRRGELHAHVAIRSNDLFWGWSGINTFEWTSLLTIVAGLTGMKRGSITFSISSLHLYEKHWERAEKIVNEYDFDRGTFTPHPQFNFGGTLEQFDDLVARWFNVEKHIREETEDVDVLATIAAFPEPMLRSWLWVLYAWHYGAMGLLPSGVKGTSLERAAQLSPARKKPIPEDQARFTPFAQKPIPEDQARFTPFAQKLHAEKHEAYGDSWKKRGEMLGIMANIARKVDRLGVAGGGDTSADTAIDLLVYLIKYRLWLDDAATPDHVTNVDKMLLHCTTMAANNTPTEKLIQQIKDGFDNLEHHVTEKRIDRGVLVWELATKAYPLAVRLWTAEQGHAERNATRFFNGYIV